MLTEILKIQPRLDNKDLNQMERTLSSRFSRIAKGFGKGLKAASVLALGSAVLDKLINPLQEVKAAIDRTLGQADDVVTNAKQFGASTENLLKLRALGGAHNVSGENLDLLLTKFQGAVAQASADPTNPANSAVKNYVGQQDTALAFYNFMLQLQKMDATQRSLVQQQVFGEKQVLKMAEFLQDVDFKEASESIKDIDFKALASNYKKLSDSEGDLTKIRNRNRYKDMAEKAGAIDGQVIKNMGKSEMLALRNETKQIKNSRAGFTVEENMAEITMQLQNLTTKLLTDVPEILKAVGQIPVLLSKAIDGWAMIIKEFKGTSIFRGIMNAFGKGKDD